MRPIVEIMTVNFSLLALDQIMNNAATLLHMSGGQCNVPLVIRMTTGAGRQVAAQHSHSLEGLVRAHPGTAHPRARHGRGRAGHAVAGARGSRPRPDLRARGALQHLRPDHRRRRCRRHRARRGPATGRRRVADHVRRDAADDARRGRAARGRRAPTPRSSTSARCDRSTTRRSSARCAGPTAPSSSTRAGGAARSRPRSARGSWSRRSTTSTRRSSGCAVPRFRCPTPSTSRTRRCPSVDGGRRGGDPDAVAWLSRAESSGCRRSAPTWTRAPCSSGSCTPATPCAAATSSRS